MDAGRELDALVAEKVMGWIKRVSADHTSSTIKALRAMGIVYAWRDAKGKERGLDVPHYSTDIAVAWEVVERMHKGIDPSKEAPYQYLTLVCVGTYHDRWAASFDFDLTHEWYDHHVIVLYPYAARGDTAPLAICLAALKAAGEDIK